MSTPLDVLQAYGYLYAFLGLAIGYYVASCRVHRWLDNRRAMKRFRIEVAAYKPMVLPSELEVLHTAKDCAACEFRRVNE